MKIPKTLSLNCLCANEQSVELTYDIYGPVDRGVLHCDFVYCERCQAPIAFLLPEGLAKRGVDRYSVVTMEMEGSLRDSSTSSRLSDRASEVGVDADDVEGALRDSRTALHLSDRASDAVGAMSTVASR